MPPEYVRQGQFSTRSDVYSFGVLVLEIICGRNNRFIHQSDTTVENLVTYVSTNSMINCGFNCIYVLDWWLNYFTGLEVVEKRFTIRTRGSNHFGELWNRRSDKMHPHCVAVCSTQSHRSPQLVDNQHDAHKQFVCFTWSSTTWILLSNNKQPRTRWPRLYEQVQSTNYQWCNHYRFWTSLKLLFQWDIVPFEWLCI